jgi:hypothetical protein
MSPFAIEQETRLVCRMRAAAVLMAVRTFGGKQAETSCTQRRVGAGMIHSNRREDPNASQGFVLVANVLAMLLLTVIIRPRGVMSASWALPCRSAVEAVA